MVGHLQRSNMPDCQIASVAMRIEINAMHVLN
jgi:hypothetical protein